MKKNKNSKLIGLLILFTIFNVLAFLIPSHFTAPFWISYAFSIILFLILLFGILFPNKLENLKKDSYSYILNLYSYIYVIIQLALLLITKVVSVFPIWLSAILNVIALSIYVFLFLGINFVSNNSKELKTKTNKKTFYLKELQIDVELLAERETNRNIKNKLDNLAEKIKFSDPMSNDSLVDLELKLKKVIEELKYSEKKDELINKANELIDERNKKARLFKWE